jgi:ribosomal protein S18 acetylase RimI-like enzyme
MPQAVACIVTAFIADPLARFLWPAPHDYLHAMPLLTREYAIGSFEHGSAFVSPDFGGAALWMPPGVSPSMEDLDRLFRETVNPERVDDVRVAFEQMEEWRPKEPHWYLPFIGVDPSAQNRGIGRALMSYGVSRCVQQGQSVYLESTNPRNISLYERHGFEVMGEIRVGKAPLITPMLRRPCG